MERILKTFREILRTELPQNADGYPAVLGQSIMGWWHGDKQIVSANELPALAFDADRRHTEFGTFHARDHDWQFSIICYVQLDNTSASTTMINEMARVVDKIISKHTRVWVFEKCIFCLDEFITPAHLTSHSELDAWATDVRDDWDARWDVTHQVQGSGTVPSAPYLDDNTAYAAGYQRFFENGTMDTGNTFSFYYDNLEVGYTTPYHVFTEYQSESVKPVRLLSFTRVGDIEYGVVPKINNAYLRGAELKISAREIDPLTQYGV